MVLRCADHLGQDRLDRAAAVGGERLVGGGEGQQRFELLDRREGEDELAGRLGVERRARLEPGRVDGLDPVRLRRGVGGGQGEEEPGVEAGRDHLRRDPAREEDQLLVGGQRDRRLLGQLAHRAGAEPRLGLAVRGVDGAAREDPDAGHELRLLGPLQQQHLEGAVLVLAAAPQQHHRGGGPGLRGLPRFGASAGPR